MKLSDMKIGKRNNEGLTLVEVIIVIAIMAVLTGMAALSISIISGLPARQCAEEVHSTLSRVRIATMGKKEETLLLTVRDDGVYLQEVIDGSAEPEKKVGKQGINVSYTLVTSGTEGGSTPLLSGSSLLFSFDRSSGAFSNIFINGVEKTDTYAGRISFQKGGKTYTVMMVPLTGKMSVSRNM